MMQTVLDNMNDGVILIDKDFRFKLGNRQFMQSLQLPPNIVYSDVPIYEIIRFQAERGDFGPVNDVEHLLRPATRRVRGPPYPSTPCGFENDSTRPPRCSRS